MVMSRIPSNPPLSLKRWVATLVHLPMPCATTSWRLVVWRWHSPASTAVKVGANSTGLELVSHHPHPAYLQTLIPTWLAQVWQPATHRHATSPLSAIQHQQTVRATPKPASSMAHSTVTSYSLFRFWLYKKLVPFHNTDQMRYITAVYGFSIKHLELHAWLILFTWSMTLWLFDEDNTPQLGAHLDCSTPSTGPTLQVQRSTPPYTEVQCYPCWLSFDCDKVHSYQSLYHLTHCQKVQEDPGP